MANNADFKKYVFRDVELRWAKLDQPHRFNPQAKQSEACSVDAQGAAYSVQWPLSLTEAKVIKADMKAHYDDCRSRDPQLPEFADIFGAKKDGDNPFVVFTGKKNAKSSSGKVNKAPIVVGSDHHPLTDLKIWSGSRGHVRVLAFPSTNPQHKTGGITLLLDAVVVTEAKYGSANLEDDFGSPSEVDPMSTVPASHGDPAPEPSSANLPPAAPALAHLPDGADEF